MPSCGYACIGQCRFDHALHCEDLKRPGDRVNMEADILGKHVYHYMKKDERGVSLEKLQRHGFA